MQREIANDTVRLTVTPRLSDRPIRHGPGPATARVTRGYHIREVPDDRFSAGLPRARRSTRSRVFATSIFNVIGRSFCRPTVAVLLVLIDRAVQGERDRGAYINPGPCPRDPSGRYRARQTFRVPTRVPCEYVARVFRNALLNRVPYVRARCTRSHHHHHLSNRRSGASSSITIEQS